MHNTINQFIWGFQQHFRISLESGFKQIAEIIGAKLTPTAFLVGVAADKHAHHAVCVEPEEGFRYTQDTFENFAQDYKRAFRTDPRAGMRQSHPVAQKNEERGLRGRSIRRAILACIEGANIGVDLETFCSFPVPVGSYEVCILLQFPTDQACRYPMLMTKERSLSPVHVYPLARSLVQSAADRFLEEASKLLWIPDISWIEVNLTDVVREAGRNLLTAPALLGDFGESLDSSTLFEACNVISASRYEGTDSIGGMLIGARGNAALEADIHFVDPVRLRDHRGIRKLLELAKDGRNLLCDGYSVYGIGRLGDSYLPKAEDVFLIRFTRHHEWELVHAGSVLMVVQYGNPRLPDHRST